jgi:hypothetical protein
MEAKYYLTCEKNVDPEEVLNITLKRYFEVDKNTLNFEDKPFKYIQTNKIFNMEKLNYKLYISQHRCIPEGVLPEVFYNIELKEYCFRFKRENTVQEEILFLYGDDAGECI